MKVCPRCAMRLSDDREKCPLHGIALEAYVDPRIGSTVAGRFFIDGTLGEGGMATVYRAKQKLSGKPVALKILHSSYASDPKTVERFRREARHVARLSHPNIVDIYEQNETEDGTVYMAMELLEGQTLADLLDLGAIDIDVSLSIMVQIARAVARAHDLDVIHRDLKPENIFLVQKERGFPQVKVLDFGIARGLQDGKLTGTGELFGTPQYMSPERIRGIEAARGDDLYSLGVVFFEMITGEYPFGPGDAASYLVKNLRERPRDPMDLNPSMPPSLRDLILTLLQKKAADRPVDAYAVETDLLLLMSERALQVPDLGTDRIEPIPLTQDDIPVNPWVTRRDIIREMAVSAYGSLDASPKGWRGHFTDFSRKVDEWSAKWGESAARERALSQLMFEGQKERQRLGQALDNLAHEIVRQRTQLREAEIALEPHSKDESSRAQKFLSHHNSMVTLEGRFGFREPSQGLANAYRTAAEQIESWLALRNEMRDAEGTIEHAKKELSKLENQQDELKRALAAHEEAYLASQESSAKTVENAHGKTNQIEMDLQTLFQVLLEELRPIAKIAPMLAAVEAIQ